MIDGNETACRFPFKHGAPRPGPGPTPRRRALVQKPFYSTRGRCFLNGISTRIHQRACAGFGAGEEAFKKVTLDAHKEEVEAYKKVTLTVDLPASYN